MLFESPLQHAIWAGLFYKTLWTIYGKTNIYRESHPHCSRNLPGVFPGSLSKCFLDFGEVLPPHQLNSQEKSWCMQVGGVPPPSEWSKRRDDLCAQSWQKFDHIASPLFLEFCESKQDHQKTIIPARDSKQASVEPRSLMIFSSKIMKKQYFEILGWFASV